MNVIERLKKNARSSVTTPEVFTSRHMKELIGAKVRYICKLFKVATPDLGILYDEKSEMTAATSLDTMYVNSGHPMFDGTDEERFLKVAGVILHEAGHILFTNYTALKLWLGEMQSGAYWPRTPDVPKDLEVSRDRLSELGRSKLLRGALFSYAKKMENCLEDGRIETLILRFIKNARFMTKGLVKLRQETFADMAEFEEISDKVDKGEWKKSTAILQLVVHYARFGSVKGNFDPATEVGYLFERIIPEIDTYLAAKEAVVYYEAFNRILVIMEETIEKELSDTLQKHQNQQQGEQGSGSGQQQGQSSSSSQGGTPQNGNGSGSPCQGQPQDSSGSESGNTKGSGNSAESETEQQDGGGSSSPVPDGSDMSSDDLLKTAAEIEKEIEAQLAEILGQTADNSDSMSDQAKGSDRGSVARRLSGLAEGEGGKVDTATGAAAAEGSGTVTHEEASGGGDTGLTLEDIARKISDEKLETALSGELTGEYGRLASEVKDYSAIHRAADITMFHYSDVSDSDIARYNEIAQSIAPLVKRAVKSSNFYEKDREVYTEDQLFSGTALHAEQCYKKDGKIFSKTYDRDEPPTIALAVRIDSSGSMSGERIKAAQRACVFLYEYALGMQKRYNIKIPLYIYGDCVRRDAPGVNMYVFADDKYRTPKEKYRLMKLAAGGCNRDGLPIRMAVKRLEQEHPEAQKLVFNITDGQPNDSDYGGEPAFADLADITRACEKKRIAFVSCAIGDDRKIINRIYGSNHFLNISDLDALPVRLVKILKKLLK